FEPKVLDELLPDWRSRRGYFSEKVTEAAEESVYFLMKRRALRVPDAVLPKTMRHRGDLVISLSRLVEFMEQAATEAGAEIYRGFAAERLIVENNRVRGVKLKDAGLAADGSNKSNFLAGEEIRAERTILCDGSRGVLSAEFARLFGGGKNPQIYSIGLKKVVQWTGSPGLKPGEVVHTLGYPLPPDVFGGGFLYGLSEQTAAVGLVLGLDWRYGDLNPQRVFEQYCAHPRVSGFLQNSKVVATGARTIPEGGYHSIGSLGAAGALVAGDAGGWVNMEKIKGIHLAIRSGMCAADAVIECGNSPAESLPESYRRMLETAGAMDEMRHAANYRQCFKWGLFAGAPLSQFQRWLPGVIALEKDSCMTRAGVFWNHPDPGGMDQATFVGLTQAMHREDEPAHMKIKDPALCAECGKKFRYSCTHFCPGQVYRESESRIILSASNCLHCLTCAVKCP
ncbi:MAG: 4Fe-4S dicluster domain-containing protein, partial [Candidatus Omnitrophica bacterium]|nr:4Fe-4S dicluster domain-containing protein [Candidatus Omnitrophota bacterium]